MKSLKIETIAISKFKATCLSVLERVRRTGQPIRVTRFGSVVADIVPSIQSPSHESGAGCMIGTGRIVGDVMSPTTQVSDWSVLK